MASVPMSGAFEPVEDVSAAGVVDLVEGVSVGLLHGDGIAVDDTADDYWSSANQMVTRTSSQQ